jgi:hypothetical protein
VPELLLLAVVVPLAVAAAVAVVVGALSHPPKKPRQYRAKFWP